MPPKKAASPKGVAKPKKKLTGFMLFSTKMRPDLKAKQPELTFGELGKELGKMWRGLSDAEKAKYKE